MALAWAMEWAGWVAAIWLAGNKCTAVGVAGQTLSHLWIVEVCMEKTGTVIREKPTTISCCIPGVSTKQWFFIIDLVLLFIALCVVVFAGELEPLWLRQSGLSSSLNLSRGQCERMRQIT